MTMNISTVVNLISKALNAHSSLQPNLLNWSWN